VREPERQCIGCGLRGPQRGFLRLGVTGDAVPARVVVVHGDPGGGRGAYLCRCLACLDRAIYRKAFERAFRTSVVLERDDLAAAIAMDKSQESG